MIEELKAFLDKHGKQLSVPHESINNTPDQQFNNHQFYQDDEMDDNDDMLLGENDQEIQMLQELEDQEAAVMRQKGKSPLVKK